MIDSPPASKPAEKVAAPRSRPQKQAAPQVASALPLAFPRVPDLSTLTRKEMVTRFNSICDLRRNPNNPNIRASLERTIFGLIRKTRGNLMKDGNHKNRFDINAKKVLRASRAYYDHRLEFCFEFKKLRRKISRSTILDPTLNKGFIFYMDQLTEKMFPDALLELFGVSRVSMSNHLAGLVCPKAFQTELDKEAPRFRDRPMSEETARMSLINDLSIKARDLLYQYNKEKLNVFMD